MNGGGSATLAEALAAFDAAALGALASKGLLRRAERDVANGLATVAAFEPGDVACVGVDGETVRIGLAGPVAASCTCSASGICRHILAATLAVAAGAAGAGAAAADRADEAAALDPVAEIVALSHEEIAAWAGRPALREAEKALATLGPPELRRDGTSLVIRVSPERPDAVWLAGRGLAGLVAKGPAAKARATGAVALLAVRRTHGVEHPASVPEAKLPPALDLAFLDAVDAALFAYVRVGFAAAPLALEQRLGELARSSRADALPRLGARVRGLAERLREKRERSAPADGRATLSALAEAYALTTALREARLAANDDPAGTEFAAQLAGRARAEMVPVGDLQMTGIGATLWTTAAGARGVTAYFFAPERARVYSASLARGTGYDAGFDPRTAYRSEPIWEAGALAALVHKNVSLRSAAASDDDRLSLGKGTRAETSEIGDPAATIAGWPIAFDDWEALERYVRAEAMPSLRVARPPRRVVLLRPDRAADPYTDPMRGQLVWPLADGGRRWIALAVPDGVERDGLATALAKLADRTRVTCVAALAERAGSEFTLRPFAVLRTATPGERFESLGLDGSSDTAPGSGTSFFAKLAKRATNAVRGGPATFVRVDRTANGLPRVLADAARDLLAVAELGGLEPTPAHAARLAASGATLRTLGFESLARAIDRVVTARPGDHAAFLAAAHLVARAEAFASCLPTLQQTS